MANSFTTQVLHEGARNVVIKLVGVLDTSDLALTTAVDVSLLNCAGTRPTPTQVRIDTLEYDVSDQLCVQLYWDATADVVAAALSGRGEYYGKKFSGLQNNAGAGKTGNVLIKTTGWAAGTQVFTLILEMVKQGPDL
jgi:hypothetical protein